MLRRRFPIDNSFGQFVLTIFIVRTIFMVFTISTIFMALAFPAAASRPTTFQITSRARSRLRGVRFHTFVPAFFDGSWAWLLRGPFGRPSLSRWYIRLLLYPEGTREMIC